MTIMYDSVHICTYSMQLEAPGGYLCPRWYIIGFQMNRTRAKAKEMPAINKINYSAVYAKIDEGVWSKHLIHPPAWQLYSVHKRSMCQIILNCGIALPEGSSAEDYWEAVFEGCCQQQVHLQQVQPDRGAQEAI